MNDGHPVELRIVEDAASTFKPEALSAENGERLWRDYRSKINVEFPSLRTEQNWVLASQGWIGYVPLGPELRLVLEPKVPIQNLFGLLEVAYDLSPRAFDLREGLIECGSLAELYERLAHVLAKRTLQRARSGLYHEYVGRDDVLPFVRGRMDLSRILTSPWSVELRCKYDEHSGEIGDNQILSWTLGQVLRSGLCTDRTLPTIRQAYRVVSRVAPPAPVSANECIRRLYNRLNDDYKPLHALCRFFLEGAGPQMQEGTHGMLPFLIDMSALFELFVARSAATELQERGTGLWADPHVKYQVGSAGAVNFDLDLAIRVQGSGRALCVVDTKYKRPERPSNDDISQVVTYALLEGCDDAVLVYPAPLAVPIDLVIGHVRVRSLTFDISGDLREGGARFLGGLLASLGVAGTPATPS